MERRDWQLPLVLALVLAVVPVAFAIAGRIDAETRIREDMHILRREAIADQQVARQEIYTDVLRVLAWGFAGIALLFGVTGAAAVLYKLAYIPREMPPPTVRELTLAESVMLEAIQRKAITEDMEVK